jgi:hypothetical protein
MLSLVAVFSAGAATVTKPATARTVAMRPFLVRVMVFMMFTSFVLLFTTLLPGALPFRLSEDTVRVILLTVAMPRTVAASRCFAGR